MPASRTRRGATVVVRGYAAIAGHQRAITILRAHQSTGRLAHAAQELAHGPRRTEIRVRERSALLVGVPTTAVAETFDRIPAPVGVGTSGDQ